MYKETRPGEWTPMDEPEVIPVIVPIQTPTVEETEEELDLITEQVAVSNIENEERHDEIMEVLQLCRQRLESSSTNESPILNQIQADLVEIKAELLRLRRPAEESPNSNTSNLPPSESTQTPTNQSEPVTAESTDDLNRPAKTAKKYRAI